MVERWRLGRERSRIQERSGGRSAGGVEWCFGTQVSTDRLVIDSGGASDQPGGGKERRLDRRWVESE
jgi:hypothetical protein